VRELPLRAEDFTVAPLSAVFLPDGEALVVVALEEEVCAKLFVAGFEAAVEVEGLVCDAAGVFLFAVPFDCAKPAGTPNPTALSSRIRSAGRRFRVMVFSRGFSSTPFIGSCPSNLLLASIGLY
jgi:hypothetical protein